MAGIEATTTPPWSEGELRAKVGQLFIVGFDGHVANDDIKALITTHKVGAIILFQRNIESASQLLELTNSLQELARSSGHEQDLFIGIDQENGLVTRIKPPIAAQLPGSMALGAIGDAASAYEVASATAEMLNGFGINMNYGPIADVNSEPKNPVIGVRSPSDDPEAVGRFVSAQIKALRERRVVSCAKHFPGHGDTAIDSHYGLPVITKSREKLKACEFVPFRRAVMEGVDSVMTAHIAMPGLVDSVLDNNDASKSLPASLNPDAIKILREDMKYDGVILSDCLEMDGVRATYGTEKSAAMAIKAGTDCAMICHTMSAQVGAIELVVQAVKEGEISHEDIQASVNRVNHLKRKYLSPSSDTTALSTSIDMTETNKRHAALASRMYARSTTVVRSVSLPVTKGPNTKCVYLLPGKAPLGGGLGGGAVDSGEKTRESYLKNTFIDLLKPDNSLVHAIEYFVSKDLDPAEEALIDQADVVVFCTRNASLGQHQKDFGLSLGKKLGSKFISIATCDPYDFLDEHEAVQNYVTMYEPTPEAFQSALDIIFGVIPATGVLPVGSVHTKPEARLLDNTSEAEITHLWNMWHEIFPAWPIERDYLVAAITIVPGVHLIHEKGFSLAYYQEKSTEGLHGMISVIGVLESYRDKGLGTALINKTREELKAKSKPGKLVSFTVGSSFPRFWPGVPLSFAQKDRDFFMHRGFRKSQTPTPRDLYKSITEEIAPPDVLERVANLPLTFSPWSPELYEECMVKQRANFSNNPPWIKAYEVLAEHNQHQEVLVAFDESGAQVGWTLMCRCDSIVGKTFAFLPLLPSKDKTGLIACVGVDVSARKKGVGLALMVKAMENMRARGLEGVLIDWVVIRGFYETLGFEVFWEYRNYDW